MAAQLQILLFVFLVLSSSASARLLNNVGNVLQKPSVLVLPCHTHDGEGNSNQETGVTGFRASATPRFGAAAKNRKYGPLVLNMLPKGRTTPSGPSKGTNSITN
ncbi:hypothetical protein ACLB2K_070077 [Fragaria x ananassa]